LTNKIYLNIINIPIYHNLRVFKLPPKDSLDGNSSCQAYSIKFNLELSKLIIQVQ